MRKFRNWLVDPVTSRPLSFFVLGVLVSAFTGLGTRGLRIGWVALLLVGIIGFWWDWRLDKKE